MKVEILSSADGTRQPCYVILPDGYAPDGEPVPFLGPKVKTGVGDQDFRTLMPGATYEQVVDLTRDPSRDLPRWAFTRSGQYRVTATYAGYFGLPETTSNEITFMLNPGGNLQGRVEPVVGGLSGAYVGLNRDVHPDVPGRTGEDGSDHETDGSVGIQQDEQDDRQDDAHPTDSRVLAVEIGLGPFLNSAGNLPHSLVAIRLCQDPFN